jgi:hypothetical protein
MPTRSSIAQSPPSALLPSRAALATLLDAAEDPLLLFDDLGRLSFGNRAAMRALGAEPGLGVVNTEKFHSCGRAMSRTARSPDRGRGLDAISPAFWTPKYVGSTFSLIFSPPPFGSSSIGAAGNARASTRAQPHNTAATRLGMLAACMGRRRNQPPSRSRTVVAATLT